MDFCEIVPVVTKETFLNDLNMILILSSGDTSLQHTNQNDSKYRDWFVSLADFNGVNKKTGKIL